MTTFECQYKCVIGPNNKDNPKFDINTIELVDILYRRSKMSVMKWWAVKNFMKICIT